MALAGVMLRAPSLPAARPYVVVAGVVVAAVAGIDALNHLCGTQRGFCSLLWLVPIIGARYYGFAPATLGVILATVSFDYFFCMPYYTLGPNMGGDAILGFAMMACAAAIAKPRRRSRALAPTARANRLHSQYWGDPPADGDYASDCAEGQQRADSFLRQLQMGQKMFVLGWIARDMIAKGRFTGLEVGFFHRISEVCATVPPHDLLVGHHYAKHSDLPVVIVKPDRPV